MDLMNIIRQKRQTLISIFLIFMVIGLLLFLSQDFKYGAKSKILVIQGGAEKVDPFSVSRSVEYLSDLLSKVVYSHSFYESVMNSDFNINEEYFGESLNKKMKVWKETVSAKSIEDSGIININVYHKDPYQAKQIALAINHVLITSHQGYHGLGPSVKINVIDQPVASSYPVKPNLLYTLVIIIAVSLFFGLVYIYLFPEQKYDIYLFGKKEASVKKSKRRKYNSFERVLERNNYLNKEADENRKQALQEIDQMIEREAARDREKILANKLKEEQFDKDQVRKDFPEKRKGENNLPQSIFAEEDLPVEKVVEDSFKKENLDKGDKQDASFADRDDIDRDDKEEQMAEIKRGGDIKGLFE